MTSEMKKIENDDVENALSKFVELQADYVAFAIALASLYTVQKVFKTLGEIYEKGKEGKVKDYERSKKE